MGETQDFNKEEFTKEILVEIKSLLSEHERRIEKKFDNINSGLNWAVGLSAAGALLTDKAKNNFYKGIQNIIPGIFPQANPSHNLQGSSKSNQVKVDWSKIKGLGQNANINNEIKPEANNTVS